MPLLARLATNGSLGTACLAKRFALSSSANRIHQSGPSIEEEEGSRSSSALRFFCLASMLT